MGAWPSGRQFVGALGTPNSRTMPDVRRSVVQSEEHKVTRGAIGHQKSDRLSEASCDQKGVRRLNGHWVVGRAPGGRWSGRHQTVTR